MYLTIDAKSSSGDTRGTSTTVYAFKYSLSTFKISREESETFEIGIKLDATDQKEITDGSRGGKALSTDYQLDLRLYPQDIVKLIEFALKEGVIDLKFLKVEHEPKSAPKIRLRPPA